MIIAIVTFLYSFYTSFLRLRFFDALMQWLALLLSFHADTKSLVYIWDANDHRNNQDPAIIGTLQNADQRL